MTIIAFIVAMLGMYLCYCTVGANVLGFSIYSIGMATVMVSTVWASRKSAACLTALLPIALMTVVAWSIPWFITPVVRMFTHIGLGAAFLILGKYRWQSVLGYIFLISSLVSSLQILGAFPPRPRVFTGLYYPDLVAYLTYGMLVVIGYGAGDVGRLAVVFRPRRYLGYNDRAISSMEVPRSHKEAA